MSSGYWRYRINSNREHILKVLEAHPAVYNDVIDSLLAKGYLPERSYHDLLIKEDYSPRKISDNIRDFLRILCLEESDDCFKTFCVTLHTKGLPDLAGRLQAQGPSVVSWQGCTYFNWVYFITPRCNAFSL